MSFEALHHGALAARTTAIPYHLSAAILAHFPGKYVLETEEGDFDPWELAHDGGCELTARATPHAQLAAVWHGPGKGMAHAPENACFDVRWEGHDLVYVLASWNESYSHKKRRFVVGERAVVERFFTTVCEHCHVPRRAILTFNGACWGKSHALWEAVQASTFDDLILAGDLKNAIRADLERFLASRAEYERIGVPWKRGLLFTGPPGNGKTHCLRAAIKALGIPCLYVQSVKSRYESEDANIGRVFDKARSLTPSCLVFEDLDAMITAKNRSFFLNQLDGFEKNAGILTIATTNHPDRLDPAIVNRPSRFDRKYNFALPEPPERAAYVRLWNAKWKSDLSDARVAELVEATDGFSFAYIKELFVSSIVSWMHAKERDIYGVLRAELLVLREHMKTEPSPTPDAPPAEDDD